MSLIWDRNGIRRHGVTGVGGGEERGGGRGQFLYLFKALIKQNKWKFSRVVIIPEAQRADWIATRRVNCVIMLAEGEVCSQNSSFNTQHIYVFFFRYLNWYCRSKFRFWLVLSCIFSTIHFNMCTLVDPHSCKMSHSVRIMYNTGWKDFESLYINEWLYINEDIN